MPNVQKTDRFNIIQLGDPVGVKYDYIDVSWVAPVETYTFKIGGASGTTVRTISVTYTDGTKSQLVSVAVS